MEVGILSMQRVDNYGSLWQACCLKRMIEDMGHSVEFIDIRPGFDDTITDMRKKFAFRKIKKIPYYLFQRKKHIIFCDARKWLLNISDERNYRENYDSIIIGSDEVFNCAQKSPWGLSLQLFGAMDNRNIISYAASFGNTGIHEIENCKYTNDICNSLKRIRHISVRDNNSFEIIKKLLGKEAEIHLDPVLVGDIPIPKRKDIKKEYILIYAYDYRLQNRKIIEEIRQLAVEEKLKVFSIGFYQSWADKNIAADPIEVLSLFYNAKYIVTDTFHGTIFSLRYHKKFTVIVQNENSQKLQDLIDRIGIQAVQYSGEKNLKTTLLAKIDYDSFEAQRDQYRKETIDYLKNVLIDTK